MSVDAAERRQRRRRSVRRHVATPRFFLVVIIVVLVVIFGAAMPSFFNGPFVIAPLLTSISIFTIVGLAQMVVLSVGHMNIAVGQMASFGAMVSGLFFQLFGVPLVVGLLAGLIAGAAIGALTGWIIARTGVNSFIVTLAMSFALIGLVPTVYQWLSPAVAFTVKPEGFDVLGRESFDSVCALGYCGSDSIPIIAVAALLTMGLIGYLYGHTRLGRELLVTGSNEKAAKLSGVATGSRIVIVHALSGALAAFAGFLLAASIGSFTPSIGDEFMLQSFVGPILGGTLLAGGYVSVTGTFLGITLALLIRKGLELFGFGIESLNVLLGLILLIALSADRIRDIRGRRKPPPTNDQTAPRTRIDAEVSA